VSCIWLLSVDSVLYCLKFVPRPCIFFQNNFKNIFSQVLIGWLARTKIFFRLSTSCCLFCILVGFPNGKVIVCFEIAKIGSLTACFQTI
jgi:hypothetical protein